MKNRPTPKKLKLLIQAMLMAFLVFSNGAFAQYVQKKSNWYFGHGAMLNFQCNGNVTFTASTTSTGATSPDAWEGTSAISDCQGNLLFYANEKYAYDATGACFNPAPGGVATPFARADNGQASSSQNSIIIPFPGHPNQYFIFSLDAFNDVIGARDVAVNPPGMYFSLVNVNPFTHACSFDPIVFNVPLWDETPGCSTKVVACEKMVAIKNADNSSYWIITHKAAPNITGGSTQDFVAYSVTKNGVSCDASGTKLIPVISTIGPTVATSGTTVTIAAAGTMKGSPSGKKLAYVDDNNKAFVFDFDNTSGLTGGQLTNAVDIGATLPGGSSFTFVSGVSFSPSSNRIYMTDNTSSSALGWGLLWEFDVTGVNPTVLIYKHAAAPPIYKSFNEMQLTPYGASASLFITEGDGNSSPTTCIGTAFNANASNILVLTTPDDMKPAYVGTGTYPAFMSDLASTTVGGFLNSMINYNPPGCGASTFSRVCIGLCNFIDNDNVSDCCDAYNPNVSDDIATIDLSAFGNILNSADIGTIDFSKSTFLVNNMITVQDLDLSFAAKRFVFKQGAGFIFKGGSTFRAINSTFEPCNTAYSWQGLEFDDNTSGTIDESQFYNAVVGVYVHLNSGNNYVNITNNLFFNNQTGVSVTGTTATYGGTITGNTFKVTEATIIRGCTTFTTTYRGIVITNEQMLEEIAQNDFVFSENQIKDKSFYGILMTNSGGTMSQNTFSNMYRSLEIASPFSFSSIENNTIEITDNSNTTPGSVLTDHYQIRVSGGAPTTPPVLIYGNDLKSTLPTINPIDYYGIYVSGPVTMPLSIATPYFSLSNVSIMNNTIKGFSYSIYALNLDNSVIQENTIIDGKIMGIYSEEPTGRSISIISNSIALNCSMLPAATAATGIYYNYYAVATNGPGPNQWCFPIPAPPNGAILDNAHFKIQSNCVSNTNNAIVLNVSNFLPATANLTPPPFPIVTSAQCSGAPYAPPASFYGTVGFFNQNAVWNNYLYNYTSKGISLNGFSGTIGDNCTAQYGSTGTTAAPAPSGQGMNSFVSNYKGYTGYTVKDINNATLTGFAPPAVTPSMIFNGNFFTGAATTVGIASFNLCAGTLLSSNASCATGQVHKLVVEPVADAELFRSFIIDNYPLDWDGTNYVVNARLDDYLMNTDEGKVVKTISSILSVLAADDDQSNIENFYSKGIKNYPISASGRKWIDYTYQTLNEDYTGALATLKSIDPLDMDEKELVSIETIRTMLISQSKAAGTLSANDIATLTAIDNRRGEYSAIARDILQAALSDHDYIFKKNNIHSIGGNFEDEIKTSIEKAYLDIYPNPASGSVHLYYTLDNSESGVVSVNDMQGRELIKVPLVYDGAHINLDINSLPVGEYVICLKNKMGIMKSSKLIVR